MVLQKIYPSRNTVPLKVDLCGTLRPNAPGPDDRHSSSRRARSPRLLWRITPPPTIGGSFSRDVFSSEKNEHRRFCTCRESELL